MAILNNDSLDEAIVSIINKDKALGDKKPMLEDMAIINSEATEENKKLASFERLIKYLSYLPQWDEELITYLGNRFTALKLKEVK